MSLSYTPSELALLRQQLEDVGDPMLAQHLHSIVMLQRLAVDAENSVRRFRNVG